MKTKQEHLQQDYARARIDNYIFDRGITATEFARTLDMNPMKLTNFLRDDERSLGYPSLHQAAKIMGITYEKLISPLGPEDYK